MTETTYPSFISKQVLQGRYLFGNLHPARVAGFTVNCAGREECAAEFHLKRTGFRYYAFEYIASGRWLLSVDGREHKLGPGTVFGYGPKTRFELRALDSTNLVKYFVDFSGFGAEAKLDQCRISDGRPGRLASGRRIHDIFDQILACANYPAKTAVEMATHLTEFLLICIREERWAGEASSSPARETYLRCRNHLETHFLSLRTVDAVARACHIDRAYLSRLFRKHGGEGPYHFLTRLKMNHAAELLVLHRASVKEAAHAVRFEDPYHFSRVFKQTFGLAPKLFVRRFRDAGNTEL